MTSRPAIDETRRGEGQARPGGARLYLPLALLAFLCATTGADLVARTAIGGETFGRALGEHLHWAAVQGVGTLLLLAPFVAVALVCSAAARRARTRSIAAIFGVAMLALVWFYVGGHQDAQHALLAERWTAATFAIGLLPVLVGIPAVLASVLAAALASRLDPRSPGGERGSDGG